jgi:HK97 family phage portal protein
VGLLSRISRRFRRKRPTTTPVTQTKARLTSEGLQIAEFSGPVTQMLRLFGFGGTYAAIYGRQQHVRTVVDGIARECAELKLKMYEKVPRSPLLPSDRIEIPDHAMAQLLAESAPGMSEFRFWFQLFADIEIYDVAYWLKIRTAPGKPPEALVRVPPANLLPFRNPLTGKVDWWVDARGGRTMPEDLVVFWGYDPAVNHGMIAPMETLRQLLAGEFAAEANREGMWKNALRKDGVIEQDKESHPMTDEARESFLVDVGDSLAGSAGTALPALLLPGMTWKDVQWSPKEMEYLAARKLSRTEVAAAFHVPPSWVAAAANGSEPDENTLKYLYKSTLPPLLTRVEDEIKAQLLPEFDLVKTLRQRRYVEFNLDSKMRGDPDARLAQLATSAGGPIITVNEARARENLPPISGGDQIFVPLNSMRGGGPQASPQNPVDTPSLGVNPTGTTPGGGSQMQSRVPADEPHIVLGAEDVAKVLSPAATGETIEQVVARYDERVAEVKSAADHAVFLKETRLRYEERAARMFEKYFARQRNTVKGGKALKRGRWDKELGDDLFGVAYQTVSVFGADAAERIKGTWDPERTAAYVRKVSDVQAVLINDGTDQLLAEDNADPDVIFGEGRAFTLARTRTTWAINWSIQEAAHQNGEV